MTIVIRCSAKLAAKLGALPAKMEGPVWRMPQCSFPVDTGTDGVWFWLIDPLIENLHHDVSGRG